MLPSRRLLNNLEHQILNIRNALFKQDFKKNEYIFSKPIADFEIHKPDSPVKAAFWSIVGPKKSQYLSILAGKTIPYPPLSRTYPYFSKSLKYDEIHFLDFKENSGLDRVHMSARYESFSYKGELEVSDDVNSVKNYVSGANNYNSSTEELDKKHVENLLCLFDLKHLENKWVNSLSNGQFRRARLAKSLISKPSLLIVDDPFLGLDPDATNLVSESMRRVSHDLNICIVLGLRLQDPTPEWIERVGYVNEEGLLVSGKKETAQPLIQEISKDVSDLHKVHENHLKHRHITEVSNDSLCTTSVPHVEFSNASVVYKDLPILKNFNWKVERGSSWRIFGNNGAGKTTILSLITADHPQSWRSVLSIDGKIRKTGNGSSFFDVNNKIGISSPELHALVPSGKSMRDVILSGLVPNVGNSNFMFKPKEDQMTYFAKGILHLFEERLSEYGDKEFVDLSMTDQKLALFLRAIIKKPELLILDEAFSCMDDEKVMMKCHNLVEKSADLTVLAIGHLDWELPKCDYLLKLYGDENRNYKLFKY